MTPIGRSHISLEKYHLLSDATMDALLESLENLLDVLGNPSYEVEYHVSAISCSPYCFPLNALFRVVS
jgi:frataxin